MGGGGSLVSDTVLCRRDSTPTPRGEGGRVDIDWNFCVSGNMGGGEGEGGCAQDSEDEYFLSALKCWAVPVSVFDFYFSGAASQSNGFSARFFSVRE